ncbi:MAG: hypothetical protein ACYC7E_00675 [Armatimonadota bacterium]
MNDFQLSIRCQVDQQKWQAQEELIVDGTVLNDEYAIDYVELVTSCFKPGEYYILTCSCGEPGCAGLFSPIKVIHEADNICWEIAEPTPSIRYIFERQQYIVSIQSALEYALSQVPLIQHGQSFPLGPLGFGAYQLNWCVETLQRGAIITEPYPQL